MGCWGNSALTWAWSGSGISMGFPNRSVMVIRTVLGGTLSICVRFMVFSVVTAVVTSIRGMPTMAPDSSQVMAPLNASRSLMRRLSTPAKESGHRRRVFVSHNAISAEAMTTKLAPMIWFWSSRMSGNRKSALSVRKLRQLMLPMTQVVPAAPTATLRFRLAQPPAIARPAVIPPAMDNQKSGNRPQGNTKVDSGNSYTRNRMIRTTVPIPRAMRDAAASAASPIMVSSPIIARISAESWIPIAASTTCCFRSQTLRSRIAIITTSAGMRTAGQT